MEDIEFDGVCLFCGAEGVDMAHMSACSLEDAKKKLTQNGADIEPLNKIMRSLAMVKTYEAVSPKEKALMYVCDSCGEFGFALVGLLTECPHCHKSHTIIPVRARVSELLGELN